MGVRIKRCYICGCQASSVEHVPAKCFFPEGNEHRKNLITVDSCKIHNEDTSKDDKYVRNIIAMSILNNAIALDQFMTKVLSSFLESPGLAKTTLEQRIPISVNGKKTFAINIEKPRFDRVIKKIGYGLYFNKFNKTLNRELIVMTQDLLLESLKLDELGEFVNQIEAKHGNPQLNGANPKVFKYAVMSGSDNKTCVMKMVFYEGFSVWLTIDEESTTYEL